MRVALRAGSMLAAEAIDKGSGIDGHLKAIRVPLFSGGTAAESAVSSRGATRERTELNFAVQCAQSTRQPFGRAYVDCCGEQCTDEA